MTGSSKDTENCSNPRPNGQEFSLTPPGIHLEADPKVKGSYKAGEGSSWEQDSAADSQPGTGGGLSAVQRKVENFPPESLWLKISSW